MTDSIKNHFDEMARNRDAVIAADPILAYEQDVRAQAVLSLLGPQKNDLILEVGCGNGRDLAEIGRAGSQCIGIDISDEMLSGAREQLSRQNISNVKLQHGDVTEMEFSDNYFDKALCSEVLEHIPNFEKAIEEMARVLKPGGHLILSTPNSLSMHGFDRFLFYKVLGKKDNHPYDVWKSYSILKQAMEKNGLTVVEHKTACFIPGYVIVSRFPNFIKKFIVSLVGAIEPVLVNLFNKNGYIIALKGRKV